MTTGTITGKGKPKGFRLIPEGEQVLHITNVEGIPRAAIKKVSMDMHDADGVSLTGKRKQTYDLENEGGYAAFYYLVLNGLGKDLDEGDEFDISELDDIYITAEIVHNKKDYEDKTLTFANIKSIIGPGEPFETDDAPAGEAAEDDEDYE